MAKIDALHRFAIYAEGTNMALPTVKYRVSKGSLSFLRRVGAAAAVMVSMLLSVAARAERGEAPGGTRLFFDVTGTSFGAKADGKTNDTKAIQTAIDSCDPDLGGAVYFPPGRYLVDTVVLSKPNLTLRGDGAIFIKRPGIPDHVFKDPAGVASGLSCYGLKFDLSKPSFKLGNGVSAFFIVRANDLRFIDCEFKNGIEEGLKLYKCQNVVIDRCRFENLADGGVQIHTPADEGYTGTRPDQDSANVMISRCMFKDIDDGKWCAGNGCGIMLYNTSQDFTTRDVLVQGNTFQGCLIGVWSEAQAGQSTRRLVVQNNIFVGQYSAAPPGAPNGQPGHSGHGVGLICTTQGAITGNTFYNIGTFEAGVPGKTSTIDAIMISGDVGRQTTQYVRIADNVIVDDRGKDAKMEYGVFVRINKDLSLGENQIIGATKSAMSIAKPEQR
jgi:polygalacturonase